MKKREEIRKYVLFFHRKIKKNKLILLKIVFFLSLFFYFLGIGLFLEINFKNWLESNGEKIADLNIFVKNLDKVLWIFWTLSIIFFLFALFFILKGGRIFKKNNFLFSGLSLHFEPENVRKNFLISNNFWREFQEFNYKNTEKVAGFDLLSIIPLGLFITSNKKQIFNFLVRKCSIKDGKPYANDFRLREYKVNYFEEIKSMNKNLAIMSFLGWSFFALFFILITLSIIEELFYTFASNWLKTDLVSKIFIDKNLGLTVFIILEATFFTFMIVLNFKIFREYFESYYKILTIGLADFEEIENFENDDDFKNILYICLKKKNKFTRPNDLNFGFIEDID